MLGEAGARGCKAADYPCEPSTCEGSSALVAQSQVLKEMMECKLPKLLGFELSLHTYTLY